MHRINQKLKTNNITLVLFALTIMILLVFGYRQLETPKPSFETNIMTCTINTNMVYYTGTESWYCQSEVYYNTQLRHMVTNYYNYDAKIHKLTLGENIVG